MTIVLGQGVEHGAHPSVLAHATKLEGVCIDVGARRLEVWLDWSVGRFTITVENEIELTTTIREVDL